MLVYVDNVLHLEKDTKEDMLELNQVYCLKEGFDPSDIYIETNIDKVQLEDRITVWFMT